MKLFSILMAALLINAPSFADDSAEHADKTTVDHSKNPITGTRTAKVKHHKKHKDGDQGMETTTTEKTKVQKDGDVKKTTTTEESATH